MSKTESIRMKMKQTGIFRFSMVLLVLVMLSSMWALSRTFAAVPGTRTLTYTTNKLEWDSAGGVNKDGSADLELFRTEHNSTVQSSDGDNVIAPGTDYASSVVLRNTEKRAIKYTAVAYSRSDDSDIRMELEFIAPGTDTTEYELPASAVGARVLGAKTGTVAALSEVSFGFAAEWTFEDEPLDETDASDTALGNEAVDEDIELTVGFYIIVEDEGDPVKPGPKTGDDGKVILYAAIFLLSLVVLIVLIKKDRDEKEEYKKAMPQCERA